MYPRDVIHSTSFGNSTFEVSYNEDFPMLSLINDVPNNDLTIHLESHIYTGMQYLGTYLKKYRLKKYAVLFKNYTVDGFLALNEEKLSAFNITLGVRTRILKCVEKLNNRPYDLRNLAIQIENDREKLLHVIEELLEIMVTPMRAHWWSLYEKSDHIHGTNAFSSIDNISNMNLPGLIMAVSSRCHQIVINSDYPLNLTIYDKLFSLYCIMYSHFAFTYTQKDYLHRRMGTIKVRRDWAESYIASQGDDPFGLTTEEEILNNIKSVVTWNRKVKEATLFGPFIADTQDDIFKNRHFRHPSPIPEPEPLVVAPLMPIQLFDNVTPAFNSTWEIDPATVPFDHQLPIEDNSNLQQNSLFFIPRLLNDGSMFPHPSEQVNFMEHGYSFTNGNLSLPDPLLPQTTVMM
uniref:PAP-associated domain-containing protein n=1 Tax=Panagrellus redivivus TaxID=6233 RepID=A0A7E4W3W5_PANRE